MQAGQVAADEGAAAITLHARTADQFYAPPASWEALQALVQQLSAPHGLPVIGNGDVFEAADAVQLMRATGCAGEAGGVVCVAVHACFWEGLCALLCMPALRVHD